MNIILNMPTPDKMEELQSRIAKWHWEQMKTNIKNSDLNPDQKQSIYDSLVEMGRNN